MSHAVPVDEFEVSRSRRLPKTPKLIDDLPEWADLRDALLSSGAIPFANEAALRKDLARELETAHRATNPRPTYFALDTNLFYHRLLRPGVPHGLVPLNASGIQVVVSDAVRLELGRATEAKYSDNDIHSLAAKLADHKRVRALTNRPYKKGRRAKAGAADLRRLSKGHRVAVAAADALTEDKEANDQLIAASYSKFRKEVDANVLLLTADHNMQYLALNEKMGAYQLETPPAEGIPTGPMDERVFCRLVHDLAVSFGVLHLSGLDTRIWGDWSSKTPADWDDEALLLEYNSESAPIKEFLRDVDAARKVEAAMERPDTAGQRQ